MKLKALVAILLVLTVGLFVFYGCEGCHKTIKHYKAKTIGIDRKVTLYSNDGSTIRTWDGDFYVELIGNAASFIDDNGREVKISGTFIVEEIK